jgi:hypothetical protein
MPDKPSRNEEEYFARAEAGRLKALAQRAADEARGAVDRCPECNGLWFDSGEAQRLVALNERRGVSGIFRSVVEAVRSPAAAKKLVE